MKNIKINLGRDGVPDPTAIPSAWIEWNGETFRFEVECYKEAWCELDKENAEKFFKEVLGAEDDAAIERELRSRFMQSPTFKNFQLLDEFMAVCKKHDVKYVYNSWSGGDCYRD